MNDLNPTIILGASGTGTTIILNELVNPALATITGVLTILILSQKLYANWKAMKDKK
jgi:predicted ATPase